MVVLYRCDIDIYKQDSIGNLLDTDAQTMSKHPLQSLRLTILKLLKELSLQMAQLILNDHSTVTIDLRYV